MVRSLISIIISVCILIVGGIYEQLYLRNTFNNFRSELEIIYDKTEKEIVTETDVSVIQNKWSELKKSLHVFVSHNDIKEFDMWIAESVSYVKQKNYGEALDKLEVAIELTEQIPKGYLIRFENIF